MIHEYSIVKYILLDPNLEHKPVPILARPLLHRTTLHASPRCCTSCIIIFAPIISA